MILIYTNYLSYQRSNRGWRSIFPFATMVLVMLKNFVSGGSKLFPREALFFCVFITSFLKTQWEKENLLITSNFSFSHSVFYPFGELSAIFIVYEIVVCKLFQFGSLKFVVWEKVNVCFLLQICFWKQ